MIGKNKRSKYTLIVLIFILCVSIGYAALTSVLKINSTLTIGKIDFDIHFDNVQPEANKAVVTEEAHIIDEAKKEISFQASMLRLNDNYKFTTDIVNEGSIPGKIKSIEFNGLTESQKKLIKFKVTYTLSGKSLAVGDYIGPESSKNITVETIFQLAEDITDEDIPDDEMSFDCTFIIHFENGDMTEYFNRAASNRLMQQTDFFPSSFVNFANPVSSDEHQGVYRLDGTENDDFPIYFYRGDNGHVFNHVNFGGYCWRIIRTTNTGGIKLIYNGVPNENGQCTVTWGAETMLIYHGFGSTYYPESSVRTWLNTWYYENFIQNQAYLEDTPYCNGSYSDWDISLDCSESDTVSMANGKNYYPIGLLTAQEANLCGQSVRAPYYVANGVNGWLNNGQLYWTMTKSPSGLWVVYVDTGNIFDWTGTGRNDVGVRPVITLNSEVVISGGEGTTTNPYTVSLG